MTGDEVGIIIVSLRIVGAGQYKLGYVLSIERTRALIVRDAAMHEHKAFAADLDRLIRFELIEVVEQSVALVGRLKLEAVERRLTAVELPHRERGE